MNEETGINGGCQCGAVRYALGEKPGRTHYCHCRMCQRATGNAFALLTGVRKTRLAWTRGAPAYFASSSLARRGYCRDCGTPLSFEYHHSDWVYVTVGSLDAPQEVTPERHYGIESRLPWLHLDDGLPCEPTADDPRLRAMTVYPRDPGADAPI